MDGFTSEQPDVDIVKTSTRDKYFNNNLQTLEGK